jgi:probable rRNA maturation factor
MRKTPEADRRRTVYLPPWRVDVVRRSGIRSGLPATTLATTIARALEAGGAPSPASVTVVLTDDAELSELNAEHMGVDGPTDVLSFPMLPPETFPRNEGGPASATASRRTPSGHEVSRSGVSGGLGSRRTHIGDIAISVERAIEQAEQGRGGQTGDVRWSAADELRLLVTHGTLHLCGWDHADPAEEAGMRALERRLLQ